jgi:hypothetical protein
VYKSNHVAGYLDNGLEEDSIEHVLFKSFEEVDLKGHDLQHFLAMYGRKYREMGRVCECSLQNLTILSPLPSH